MVCEGLVLGNFFGIASALSPLWLWNARAVDELFGHWTGLTNFSFWIYLTKSSNVQIDIDFIVLPFSLYKSQ